MTLHGEPNAADYVRSFVAFHRHGLLSTHSARVEGFPFGSILPYITDPEGRIVISISKISEHYRNLENTSKAGLLIQQRFFENTPRAGGRTSIMLSFEDLPSKDYEGTAQNYIQKYGAAAEFELSHDFVFKLGFIKKIRWIADFGSMGWLSAEEYTKGQVDVIAASGIEAVEHMNNDHPDALELLIRTQSAKTEEKLPEKLRARMLSIDSLGFTLEYHLPQKREVIFFPFTPPLQSPDELRPRVVEIVKKARSL